MAASTALISTVDCTTDLFSDLDIYTLHRIFLQFPFLHKLFYRALHKVVVELLEYKIMR